MTQFLTVAYSPTGELLGGTVDNGILYIDFMGNDPMYAQWWGGNIFSSFLQFRDGGDVEISTLDPSFKFYTTPGGTIHRRMIIEDQVSYQTYYGTGNGGAWLSPMSLWESYNDPLSWDTVLFIADRDYAAGETIVAESLTKKYPLTYTLEEPLAIGDTVKVQDTFQAILAFGKKGEASVKMNRHPLSGKDKYRNQTYTVLDRNTRVGKKDNTIEVEISSDAYYMFAATWDDSDQHYKIYRVSNLQNARDRSTTDTYTGFDPITGEITYVEVTEEIGHFDQVVTSIRVDPTNNDNVITTLGNYGNESNIYLCTTATTAADSSMAFVSIQGNLPQAPVYDVLFNWRDHKEVLVATEYGVYSTSDVFANPVVWASENHNGMEIVPVFELRQQKFENSAEFGVENHGVIYAATYGRGLFKSETFATKGGASSSRTIDLNNLKVAITPNPVSDIGTIRFELAHSSNVDFMIYDMQGKLVKSIRMDNQPAGQHESAFDSRELGAGTYLIWMHAEGHQKASKFMIK